MRADQHHGHTVKGECVDVIERQRRNHGFATITQLGTHQRTALQHVGDDVAVGQHRSLGYACSTTGVLQNRHVITGRIGFAQRLAATQRHGIGELDRLG